MLFRSFIFFVLCLCVKTQSPNWINNRLTIGIMTEELNSTVVPEAKSFMLASYVKFIEAAGARVVPIWIRQPVSYYEDIMSKINGILFPGGGDILKSNGYGRTGQIIYDIATRMNDNGDFFPIWGTCLGFELLNYLAANDTLWMKSCAAEDLPTNIEFVNGYKNSRMFQDLDMPLKNKMNSENVTIHYHQWCLTPQNYSLSGLDKYFKVLAVNRDSRGMTFVSIIEANKYPYYAVSFHPEKVMFEWSITKTHQNIPHTADAIRTSQYFADFFINQARKSTHRFLSKKNENDLLIYNYNPVFTAKIGSNPNFQTYYFMQ
ncbi:gamma-glutamyl hydrolase [Caerostris darwini]|uniref:folate gamma-glutamyl hydrolase n=1 Tax=Caerostris darwini TaxID=1538125 RepID=A0AAV4WUI2_9ARAC|nr:gamma-glutamyl hydrolase [Caerostris darwini]